MKILELTNYSAGGCGVFARVKNESSMLKKLGHEVMILSSNFEKGTNNIMPGFDKVNGIPIKRLPANMPGYGSLKYLPGGEGFMFWDFKKAEEEVVKFKPQVIIAHAYRHPHTIFALKMGRKYNARVLLVTHAPFARERSLFNRLSVSLYDLLIGRKALKKFNKVIAITHWEMPYLEKLGLDKEKVVYIPNGVNEEFFSKSTASGSNKILYTGRIAPIKFLETLIQAIPLFDNSRILIELYGPAEKEYLKYLSGLARELGVANRIKISNRTYNYRDQIKEMDSADLFVLPSKTEGMPQVLVEAMARGKIVIASDNLGDRDLINEGENGFLFRVGDYKALSEKINIVLTMKEKDKMQIKKRAISFAKNFSWSRLSSKLNKLITDN